MKASYSGMSGTLQAQLAIRPAELSTPSMARSTFTRSRRYPWRSIGAKPSHKKVLGICRQLNELVGKIPTFIRPEAMVYRVNQVLRGWAGYFGYGTYSPAFALVHERTLPTGSVGGYVGSSTSKVKGTANSRTAIWSGRLGLLNLTSFQPSDS